MGTGDRGGATTTAPQGPLVPTRLVAPELLLSLAHSNAFPSHMAWAQFALKGESLIVSFPATGIPPLGAKGNVTAKTQREKLGKLLSVLLPARVRGCAGGGAGPCPWDARLLLDPSCSDTSSSPNRRISALGPTTKKPQLYKSQVKQTGRHSPGQAPFKQALFRGGGAGGRRVDSGLLPNPETQEHRQRWDTGRSGRTGLCLSSGLSHRAHTAAPARSYFGFLSKPVAFCRRA